MNPLINAKSPEHWAKHWDDQPNPYDAEDLARDIQQDAVDAALEAVLIRMAELCRLDDEFIGLIGFVESLKSPTPSEVKKGEPDSASGRGDTYCNDCHPY